MLSKRANNPKTYFSAKSPPAISITTYLLHLVKNMGTPPAALILMMVYVERFLQSLSNAMTNSGSKYPYLLTSSNAHRIILTALLLAHKYSMDVAYPFSLLSKVVGVSASELKILEYEFLFFVKYELYISQDLYSKYEEVVLQWPLLPDELEQQASMQGEESEQIDQESRTISTIRKEEAKDEEEVVPLKKHDNHRLTDEEMAQEFAARELSERPICSNPHCKPVNEEVPAHADNHGVRSLYTDDCSQVSNESDDDTEMTTFDVEDLGIDDFAEDVIIQC